MDPSEGSVKVRSAGMDPLVPSRADHRFVKKLLSTTYGSKVEHRMDECDLVCRVFLKAGGSWERLFLGSYEQISLLKKILRVAYKKGYLTQVPEWT